MSFQFADAEKLYIKDPNVKKEDVKIIQEWLKTQPHLPELKDLQIMFFLHSTYYKVEAAKPVIDRYFTVRTFFPNIFLSMAQDRLKSTVSNVLIKTLPKTTTEGYSIMLLKLAEFKAKNFNPVNFINLICMVFTLYLHQVGFDNGAVALFDAKGFTLEHMGRIDNPNVIQNALIFFQDAAPVRIKGIHIINTSSVVDKFVALFKPYLAAELYNMLKFHSPNSDTLYESIPKHCLPEEYGGQQFSCQKLNEQNLKELLESYELFEWHNKQVCDEYKRIGDSILRI